MKPKREELLTVRIEPRLGQRINALAHKKIKTKSDIIREAIEDYIKRGEELKELKSEMAKKFAANKVSFQDLVRIIGYEEASKVAFFIEKAKRAFKGFK